MLPTAYLFKKKKKILIVAHVTPVLMLIFDKCVHNK